VAAQAGDLTTQEGDVVIVTDQDDTFATSITVKLAVCASQDCVDLATKRSATISTTQVC
jgi:hypothetical protein